MFILSILNRTAAICIVDYDEELMDLWSLTNVIEWHTFLLFLSPRDTKSHHGLVTSYHNDPFKDGVFIIFSFYTANCVQFLARRKSVSIFPVL